VIVCSCGCWASSYENVIVYGVCNSDYLVNVVFVLYFGCGVIFSMICLPFSSSNVQLDLDCKS
jgi:hypothetical protein